MLTLTDDAAATCLPEFDEGFIPRFSPREANRIHFLKQDELTVERVAAVIHRIGKLS